jgi:alanine racemase
VPVERSSFDPWVEVRPDHLRTTWRRIHRRCGRRPILAVHQEQRIRPGVAAAAQAIEGEPAIAGFAVVKLHEAATLRDAGVRKPVLCMGPLGESDLARRGGARHPADGLHAGRAALERIAARRGRTGVRPRLRGTGDRPRGRAVIARRPLLRDLAARRGVTIAGTMMTFTEDPDFDREQLPALPGAVRRAPPPKASPSAGATAASSFALFQNEGSFLDMVRPGMALYGVYSDRHSAPNGPDGTCGPPSPESTRRVLEAAARGRQRRLQPGYLAKETSGWPRCPSGTADGLAPTRGQGRHEVKDQWPALPIVATVSASHCIVELGRSLGRTSATWPPSSDWEDGSRPEDLAAAFGGSVYDLLMHLGPLLPRRAL